MRTHRRLLLTALVIGLACVSRARAADPTLELVQTIELKGKAGGLDHVTLDTKRQRLLVADSVNNRVDVVDLKEGKPLKPIGYQAGVQGLAYAPDLDLVVAALGSGGYVNVFNAADYKPVKAYKFQDDADNVRYHQPTKRIYVAHAENALGVIDADKKTVVTNIELPASAESFQLEKERPRLYVNTPANGEVVVIDTDKNEILKRYPVKLAGKNFSMVLDEANKRLYLGCRKDPKVVVMDSDTGKEISSVDIPGDIDDLWLDAKRKRLYASCGEGFLAVLRVVDADTVEPLDKVETAKGARTCYFDRETSRIFLAVPRQEGKQGPEIRVYQAK